ncbi:hypothetical protein [Sphingobacterium multivorum]|uniref:hypothetical protein n=1 Tax=Sphingobacterium multivorum TaxID=28454 RepID=UPI003016367E
MTTAYPCWLRRFTIPIDHGDSCMSLALRMLHTIAAQLETELQSSMVMLLHHTLKDSRGSRTAPVGEVRQICNSIVQGSTGVT